MDRRRFLRGAGEAVVAAPVLALGLGSVGVSEYKMVSRAVLVGVTDGSETGDNQVDWAKHKAKIGDPWKHWHVRNAEPRALGVEAGRVLDRLRHP